MRDQTRARCMAGVHDTARPTAVDCLKSALGVTVG